MIRYPYITKLSSALSLFSYFLIIFLSFGMAKFLPSGENGLITIPALFNFTGILLGVLLCTLLLPLPDKNRPLTGGLVLIILTVIAQILIRSAGLQSWNGSMYTRIALAVLSGMLCPVACGLFFTAWKGKNQISRYSVFTFAVILSGSIILHRISFYFLENSLNTQETLSILWRFLEFTAAVLGLAASITLIMLKVPPPPINGDDQKIPQENEILKKHDNKTNLPMILKLSGLTLIFTVLNGTMNMQLFSSVRNSEFYSPNFVIQTLIVIILTLLAGRSINSFLRRFLLPSTAIFILMPCLLLFGEYPLLTDILSTLIAVYHLMSFVIFTAAVVENYAGSGMFYGIAVIIPFLHIFSFLGPFFSRFLNNNLDFLILYMLIASVFFIILSFWVIYPGAFSSDNKGRINFNGNHFESIFRGYGLTDREIDVAAMLIEGMNNEEISNRIFRAKITVKNHITNIFKKFGVKNRAEFLALLLKKIINLKEPEQNDQALL